ncbi:uncharacterized protein BCR38DRAFT_321198, partial [Pseudomassariella vexata]
MAEEPTLPHMPAVSWDAETQTVNHGGTRKRGRGGAALSSIFSNSSDPAVFSSDDDPHVDNYTQGHRCKKRYVGSWYQQHPAGSGDSTFGNEGPKPISKSKRTLERHFDSGVWMGSDMSTDIEDAIEIQQPATNRLPQPNTARPTISAAEQSARQRITAAIEHGQEDVDLTSLGLETLSNATIAPLSELAVIPTVAPGTPFEHTDPSLKVYLSSNPLIRAPGALFNLEFLTVLSLRNTQISELPPAIANLRNLKTLNLSLNRLRYLPAELLDLMTYPGKLKELMVHPNPFHQPEGCPNIPALQDDLRNTTEEFHYSAVEASVCDENWQALALARTPVQYTDSRGIPTSRFRLPMHVDCTESVSDDRSPLTIETEELTAAPLLPRSTWESPTSATSRSRVPSLLEVALIACSRTAQLPQLPSLLPDSAPPHMFSLLRSIANQSDANANSGDVPCSTCKRRIIVPVAQWIEWWNISRLSLMQHTLRNPGTPDVTHWWVKSSALSTGTEERAVPFWRRACSWACLP